MIHFELPSSEEWDREVDEMSDYMDFSDDLISQIKAYRLDQVNTYELNEYADAHDYVSMTFAAQDITTSQIAQAVLPQAVYDSGFQSQYADESLFHHQADNTAYYKIEDRRSADETYTQQLIEVSFDASAQLRDIIVRDEELLNTDWNNQGKVISVPISEEEHTAMLLDRLGSDYDVTDANHFQKGGIVYADNCAYIKLSAHDEEAFLIRDEDYLNQFECFKENQESILNQIAWKFSGQPVEMCYESDLNFTDSAFKNIFAMDDFLYTDYLSAIDFPSNDYMLTQSYSWFQDALGTTIVFIDENGNAIDSYDISVFIPSPSFPESSADKLLPYDGEGDIAIYHLGVDLNRANQNKLYYMTVLKDLSEKYDISDFQSFYDTGTNEAPMYFSNPSAY